MMSAFRYFIGILLFVQALPLVASEGDRQIIVTQKEIRDIVDLPETSSQLFQRIRHMTGQDGMKVFEEIRRSRDLADVFLVRENGTVWRLRQSEIDAMPVDRARQLGLRWLQYNNTHIGDHRLLIALPDGRQALRGDLVRGMGPEAVRRITGKYPEQIPELWGDQVSKGHILLFRPGTPGHKWVNTLDFLTELDGPLRTETERVSAPDREVPSQREPDPEPESEVLPLQGLESLVERELAGNDEMDRDPEEPPVPERPLLDPQSHEEPNLAVDLLEEIPADSPLNELRRDGSEETLIQEWMRVTGSTLRPSRGELILYLGQPERYVRPVDPADQTPREVILTQEEAPIEYEETSVAGEEKPFNRESEPDFDDLPLEEDNFLEEASESDQELRESREQAHRAERQRRDQYGEQMRQAEESRRQFEADQAARQEAADRHWQEVQERLERLAEPDRKPEPRSSQRPPIETPTGKPIEPSEPTRPSGPSREEILARWDQVIATMNDTADTQTRFIKGQQDRLERLRRGHDPAALAEQEAFMPVLEVNMNTIKQLLSVAKHHRAAASPRLPRSEWDKYDPQKHIRQGKWGRHYSHPYGYFRDAVQKNRLAP